MFFSQLLRLLCLILLLSQVACIRNPPSAVDNQMGRDLDKPRSGPPSPGRPWAPRP
ncbi:hypothetical protein C5167_029613 [Papaver somniferum]|nr:hypothetical protein C5167_029613 [Papaver somniferum]